MNTKFIWKEKNWGYIYKHFLVKKEKFLIVFILPTAKDVYKLLLKIYLWAFLVAEW